MITARLKRFHDWLERLCFRIEAWEFSSPLPRSEVIERLRKSTDPEQAEGLTMPKLPFNKRMLMHVHGDSFILYSRDPAICRALWAVLFWPFLWFLHGDPSRCFVGTLLGEPPGCRISGTYGAMNRTPRFRRGIILGCSAAIPAIALGICALALYELLFTIDPDLSALLKSLIAIPFLPALYLVPYLGSAIGHWLDSDERRLTRMFLEWIVQP